MKNECGKTRPVSNPYEVWTNGTWTWKVLKKYQAPDKEDTNPHARWFVSVDSPYATDERGDEYVHKIKKQAWKI